MRLDGRALALLEEDAVLPALPYRGIQPYRYADHPIFFAREEEIRDLLRLVVVYRGVMLYGDSGAGKSSLINAGLIAAARHKGFQPELIRVQPTPGQELVVERRERWVVDQGDPSLAPLDAEPPAWQVTDPGLPAVAPDPLPDADHRRQEAVKTLHAPIPLEASYGSGSLRHLTTSSAGPPRSRAPRSRQDPPSPQGGCPAR
jgi:hypothetical protein